MGCPFLSKRPQVQRPTEYPYESLYRPWSWILSSCSNLLIFAILVGILYALYRRRRSRRATVYYRRVELEVNDEPAADREGNAVSVLVTGGNGVLGKSLIKCLLMEGGYRVHSLDLWIPKEEDRNPEVCSYIQADITNLDDMVVALQGVDAVFHTASITPMVSLSFSDKDFHAINTTGTRNIVEACKKCGVKRLVYTSTVDVVMSKDPSQKVDGLDETSPIPSSPLNAYTASKAAAEKIVREANGQDGLLTCALRPAILLSSGNPMIKLFLSGQSCVPGDGAFQMCFVPMDAASEGHILAERKLREEGEKSVIAGKAYNLGIEDRIPFHELAGYGAKGTTIWGRSPPYSVPSWLVCVATYVNVVIFKLFGIAPFSHTLGPMCLDFLRSHTYTSSLAHKELGWKELAPWQEYVRKIVEERPETKKDL